MWNLLFRMRGSYLWIYLISDCAAMTNMKQIYSKIAETAGLLNGCFKKVDKEIKRINSEPVSSETYTWAEITLHF